MGNTANLVLGIDPGLGGALAWLDPLSNMPASIYDMPTFEIKGKRHIDIHGLAAVIKEHARETKLAMVEEVGPAPKQGVVSTFRFGMSFGMLHGVLAAFQIPMFFVRPPVWKGTFGLGHDKDESRRAVCRMFPQYADKFSRKKDDGRAEALLIALFGTNLHSVQKYKAEALDTQMKPGGIN